MFKTQLNYGKSKIYQDVAKTNKQKKKENRQLLIEWPNLILSLKQAVGKRKRFSY